jgi:hypothetical protein
MKKVKSQSKERKIPKPASKSQKPANLWKIAAIVVILVFGLLMVGAAIKAYHFRSSFVRPTEAQIEYAKAIAVEKLLEEGENASSFDIYTADRMPSIVAGGTKRSILEVTLYNDAVMHTYLVDANSGEVLLHTKTEAYVLFGPEDNLSRHPRPFPMLRPHSGHADDAATR